MKVTEVIVLASGGASYDFSALTSQLGPLGLALVAAAAAVIGAALAWTGVSWGFPKLMGLFKKTAK